MAATSCMQVPDPDGVYRWRSRSAAGDDLLFEYKPPRIDPALASTVEWRDDQFVYAYSISNGPSARDRVVGCFIEVAHPVVDDRRAPEGWTQIGPRPPIPRIGWFVQQGENGVLPDRSVAGFILRSANWPGPMVAKCNAGVIVTDEPQWLPPEAKRLLADLRRQELVELQVLAPAIVVNPAGPPSLTYAAVVRAYRAAVASSALAHKSALVGALDELRAASANNQNSATMERLLEELVSLADAAKQPGDSVHLAQGLSMCLQRLLELEQRRQ